MRKTLTRMVSTIIMVTMMLTITNNLSVTTYAEKNASEIVQQIKNTYSRALSDAGRTSFDGWCGAYVSRQLNILGITTNVDGGNGCDMFDKYKNMSKTSGGYPVTAYPATSYSIKSSLNTITSNGTKNAYNILIGFQVGYQGNVYGHVCFIHAIIGGTVYYSESYNTTVGGTYYKEGSPISCSIDTFHNYYTSIYTYEGTIYFENSSTPTPHVHNYDGGYAFREDVHPHYSCYYCSICGVAQRNTNEPNVLASCDLCTTPGKPALIDMKDNYLSTEEISFAWNTTVNTTHYNLYIRRQNDSDEFQNYDIVFYATSPVKKTLPVGRYSALIQSTNSNAWTDDGFTWKYTNGELAYFTVSSPLMWFKNSNMTDSILVGNNYDFDITVCGNNGVKWYALVIYDSENNAVQIEGEDVWKVASTNECSAKNAAQKLNFASLEKGNYLLSVQCMDNDDNYFTIYEKEFTVIATTCTHIWNDGVVTTPATCETDGVKTYTCADCGEAYTEAIPALGHNWGEWVYNNDATYDADGTQTRVCANDPSHTETVTAPGTKLIKPNEPIDPDAPQVIVSSARSMAGRNIDVTVSLANNPGLASMTLRVAYDESVLTLTGVDDARLLGAATHSDRKTSPYVLCWVNDTATQDFTANSVIATLHFTVDENAAVGSYPITVDYDYNSYGIYNVALEKLNFQRVNGSLEITDVLIGDVNGDGEVNNLDRVVLTRYLANWADYPASAVDMQAADVNGDGEVNNLDRVILTRHLANWSGYEELPYHA